MKGLELLMDTFVSLFLKVNVSPTLYRRSDLQRVLECAQKSFFFLFIDQSHQVGPLPQGQ